MDIQVRGPHTMSKQHFTTRQPPDAFIGRPKTAKEIHLTSGQPNYNMLLISLYAADFKEAFLSRPHYQFYPTQAYYLGIYPRINRGCDEQWMGSVDGS